MTILRSIKIIIIKAQFNHTEIYLNMGLLIMKVVFNTLFTKKIILKSNSFDVMQTDFFAFTCKFGLVL